MKLLVTGGAGFIGSNFIHFVLGNTTDVEIVNLDLLTYAGNLENLKQWERDSRYRFVEGDICDAELLETLVPKVDTIVHFAAESHVDRSILDAGAFIRTNVMGTQALLEGARKYTKRFHHVSTDEVFGSLAPEDAAFTETTPYDPRSPYSASKAASDHLVRASFHTYALPVTISNTSNNYGPYHFPEKFIPLAITNLLEGKKVPVYGDGLQVRDWIHVTDHVRGIWLVLKEGKIGETYCLGGNSERTNLTVVREILKLLGKNEEMLEYVKDRPGHDRRYAINSDKAKRELGWVPEVSFEEGLGETVKWYEENRAWWENVKSGAYREYYERQYGKQ
ncbi:MAG: dTDP-glucose 4,6-dehydratase [Candidatus Moraniibacteriota bacterium]